MARVASARIDENGKLCGDIDFESVSKKASFITPVPGGVGPKATKDASVVAPQVR